MWSPIQSLREDQSSIWNPFFTHMKWELLIWSSALWWCGWLALFFDQCLHERTIWNTNWIFMTSSLLGVTFLDQPFWLLQLSISNISRITTSMLAFQAPHLVYLQRAVQPYTREKWPLSKEPFLILTWNNLIKSTCLILFLSTKWFPIVTRI